MSGHRRPRRFWQRGPVFGWSVLLVFTFGILIGAMLARPATSSRLPVRGSTALQRATAPAAPAAIPQVAVRDDRSTAGFEVAREVDAEVVDERSEAVPLHRPSAVVPPYRGTLIVTSTPRGAAVFVNGEYAGQTPLIMRGVASGSRALRVALDGYASWSRGVTVVASESTTVSARLARNQ